MKNFKLFYLLIALMASTTFAWADDSGTCGDNLTWSYVESTHTLTISGTGVMTNYSSDYVPWKDYKSAITSVVLPDGLTSIGKWVFFLCTALTSIDIPASVTTIEQAAFNNSHLQTVHFADGSQLTNINASAFLSCTSLTSISIPAGVTSIGAQAFYGCTSLSSIDIPASVTSIGQKFIRYCSNLTSISVDANNTVYDSRDNCNAIIQTSTNKILYGCSNTVIPSGVTSIGTEAFSNYSNLTTIEIPNTVTQILSYAFSSCTGMTSIDIPISVTSITDNAFKSCTGLTDVTVHWTDLQGVTTSANAFYNVTLSSVNLHVPYGTKAMYESDEPWNSFTIVEANPSGTCGANLFWEYNPSTKTLTISGTGAMDDYNGYSSNAPWNAYQNEMTTVVIENGATTIGANAFSIYYPNLTSVTIPATVTSIGNFAFYYCPALTSITIPEGLTSIGNHAFQGCRALTSSINIPAGVTSIGVQAIADCRKITSISVDANNTVYDSRNNCNAIIETATNKLLFGCKNTLIPATVTRIEEDAFSYCSNLTSITIPEGVTSIGNRAFENCAGLTSITIPSSVTSIGNLTFTQCSGLTDVYVKWTDLSGVTMGLYIFQLVTLANVNLHLPFEAWGSYSGEPWNGFKQVPVIIAKEDPDHAGVYYNTFYHGSVAYALPSGVEAYTAQRSGSDLILTKIAQAGDVLPAGAAVILKSSVASYEMTPSEETPVTVGENDLQGVDAATAAPSNCYVLSGKASDNSVTGVGFYTFSGTLGAHKAYMVVSGGADAPKRLRFVFDAATGVESLQPSDVSIQKVMRDGVILIERDGRLYDLNGRMVK